MKCKLSFITLIVLFVVSACSNLTELEATIEQQNERAIAEDDMALGEEIEEVDGREFIEEDNKYEPSLLGTWYSGLGDSLIIFNQVREIEFLPDGTVIIFGAGYQHERTWELCGEGNLIIENRNRVDDYFKFIFTVDPEHNILTIQDEDGGVRSWTREDGTLAVASLPEEAVAYREIIEAFATITIELSEPSETVDPIWDDILLIDYEGFVGFYHRFYRIESLMYALYDLNGNGIPELMIGRQLREGGSCLFAVYTLQDGNPRLVTNHFFRTSIDLTVDGIGNPVIAQLHGRFGHGKEYFFRLDVDGSLITLDRIETSDYNEDGYVEDPWTFLREVNNEFVSITREEYETLMAWYGIMGYATFYGPTGPVADYNSGLGFDFEDPKRYLDLDWQPILVRGE